MADGNCGLFDEYQADVSTGQVPPYPHTFIAPQTVKYHRVSNSSFSEPALGPDGTIYVSFDDAYIRAVDPNGQLKWARRAGWIGNFTLTVGSDGLIYAAGDHENLYVLDPNGKELARFEGHNWLAFPVIAEDGTLIVSDANDTVWALTDGSCGGQPFVLHRVADLDYDRTVGFSDIAALVDDWLECSDTTIDPETGLTPCDYEDGAFYLTGDVDRNQYVDLFDFAAAANEWMSED
ncbi:MAG: NHL repeat-containing protein [Planctomycetota bacterium]